LPIVLSRWLRCGAELTAIDAVRSKLFLTMPEEVPFIKACSPRALAICSCFVAYKFGRGLMPKYDRGYRQLAMAGKAVQ
jgi:hypothetical protein